MLSCAVSLDHDNTHTTAYPSVLATKIPCELGTEVEIPTEVLANVRFLSRFRLHEGYHPHHENILETLNILEVSTPQRLINTLGTSFVMRAEILHTLWRLVADNFIEINMTVPISMASPIWSAQRGIS